MYMRHLVRKEVYSPSMFYLTAITCCQNTSESVISSFSGEILQSKQHAGQHYILCTLFWLCQGMQHIAAVWECPVTKWSILSKPNICWHPYIQCYWPPSGACLFGSGIIGILHEVGIGNAPMELKEI